MFIVLDASDDNDQFFLRAAAAARVAAARLLRASGPAERIPWT